LLWPVPGALGSSAILPTMLQTLMGYPVFQTGLLVAPRGLGAILSMPFSTRLMRIVDPRWVILVGIVMLATRGQSRATPIAFGPFLAAAGWLMLMFGQELVTGYLGLFAPHP